MCPKNSRYDGFSDLSTPSYAILNNVFINMLPLVLYVLSSAKIWKNNIHNFFDPKPNKGAAMQVLVIDIDDSKEEYVHEEFNAFCCENLTTHHCKTWDCNLCKFCIIDHYKNTAFTKGLTVPT